MPGVLFRVRSVVRALWHHDALDREVDEEFRFHLERRVADLMQAGFPETDARRRARLEFGGMGRYREEGREARGLRLFDECRCDLRWAGRGLARNPGFACVAIVTLALGIGANSAIFSVVNAVLLRPLPYQQPERLVSVDHLLGGVYLFVRDHARSVQAIALYQSAVGFNLSHGGEAERATGARVSANLFSTLGISASVGRPLLPREEQPGQSDVVIISHAFWQQRFGGDVGIVGQNIMVDSEPRTVVGVYGIHIQLPLG